jgi:predicted PurR-regulated permease PerM
VLVNAWHVVIWAAIFAFTGAGFFWPIFPALAWAIGLGFNWWDVYRRVGRRPLPAQEKVPAEQDIRREMDALRTRAELRAVTR